MQKNKEVLFWDGWPNGLCEPSSRDRRSFDVFLGKRSTLSLRLSPGVYGYGDFA